MPDGPQPWNLRCSVHEHAGGPCYISFSILHCIALNHNLDHKLTSIILLYIYIYILISPQDLGGLCLCIYLSTSIYLSSFLSFHLSVYLSIYLSIYLSYYFPSSHLSFHLSLYLSIYLSVWLACLLSFSFHLFSSLTLSYLILLSYSILFCPVLFYSALL